MLIECKMAREADGFAFVKLDEVEFGKEIGSGGFGRVYLAKHKQWGDVAIKKFKKK